jgi:hypothetical protein
MLVKQGIFGIVWVQANVNARLIRHIDNQSCSAWRGVAPQHKQIALRKFGEVFKHRMTLLCCPLLAPLELLFPFYCNPSHQSFTSGHNPGDIQLPKRRPQF